MLSYRVVLRNALVVGKVSGVLAGTSLLRCFFPLDTLSYLSKPWPGR